MVVTIRFFFKLLRLITMKLNKYKQLDQTPKLMNSCSIHFWSHQEFSLQHQQEVDSW